MMFSPSSLIASSESVGVRLPLSWVSATYRSMSALSRDPCSCKVLPHEIRTGRCGMQPLISSQDVFGLVVCFFYHVGGILLDKGKAVPETHQIHHPDARICGHSTRGAVPIMENRSKIEEVTHTLYQQDIRVSWASTQIFHEIIFVQGHSLMHLVLRCRCPPISSVLHPQNITQSFPTILRDIRSSHTGRVWSGPLALSLSNDCHLRGDKRMSQIPATFLKVPYAVDYCGFSCCLSSGKRARKLLVKSRSVGERIENFMVTWPNSQEQGTHAERTGYGDKQRSRYCWVPDELEREVDAWYSDAQRAEVWRLQFFTFLFYLIFMGQILS